MTDVETPVEEPTSEETAVEETPPAAEGTPDVAKLEATNSKLYARATKAEEQVKNLRQALEEDKPQEVKPEVSASPEVQNINDMREQLSQELRLEVAGHNASEVAFIKRNTEDGVTLQEVAERPEVVAGINAMREAQKAEQATPAPSSRKADIPTPEDTEKTIRPRTFAEMRERHVQVGRSSSMRAPEQWRADQKKSDSQE